MGPTDQARERTLARLRDGYACGTLGTGTLERRVDVALRATNADELRGLTADLPAADGRWRHVERTVRSWLWPDPAPAPGGLLASPVLGSGQITLGRSSRCELVLDEATVSRRHAALRLRAGHWFIVDLGSSNGTWVNDRRVFDAQVVPGDEIRLGAARFRL